jgi:flotillin
MTVPAVFTIGPHDDVKSLEKYAVLLTGDSDGQVASNRGTIATGRGHVQDIVRGIIEGETRYVISRGWSAV